MLEAGGALEVFDQHENRCGAEVFAEPGRSRKPVIGPELRREAR